MDLRERITFEPDPVWTDRYEAERERVEAASGGGLLGVFHVGSTAIAGVPGKPALDVLAVYEDYESMRAAAETLAESGNGSEADGESEDEGDGADRDNDEGGFELASDDGEAILLIRWEGDSAVFVKMHLAGDEKATNQVLFREYLRDNPGAREEYTAAKREAREAHPEDPQAYTAAKSEVVGSLLADAREAGYDEDLPAFL